MTIQASAVVKGTLYWPFMGKHNPMKPGKFTVDLGDLSKEAVKALKEIGLAHRVKVDAPRDGYREENGKYVSDEEGKTDKPMRGSYIVLQSGFKPTVVDNFKHEVDADVVGNGTIANVIVNAYDWTFKGTKGVSGGFNAVQVTDLVEFRGGGSGPASLDQFNFETPDESPFGSEEDADDDVDFE
jgi:hypothetical protein